MQRLTGKVALVTGASRGYGRAIAERLARDGAFVVVHYATNGDAARAAVASIEAAGGEALPLAAPLDGSPAGVDALFTRLDAELAARGQPATVDILVVVLEILAELVRIAVVKLSVRRYVVLRVKRECPRLVRMRQSKQIDPVLTKQRPLSQRWLGVPLNRAIAAEDSLGQKVG